MIIENKIIFFAYREWAFSIIEKQTYDYVFVPEEYCDLARSSKLDVNKIKIYNKKQKNEFKNNLLLYFGWSWIVEKQIINKNTCVCLHPSALPKYRGGSPIQNQILDGLDNSAVTLFKMSEGLDDGPLYDQKQISLNGDLSDIFKEIVEKSIPLTKNLINDYLFETLIFKNQNEQEATFCKRRKKEESELTLDELTTKGSKYLHNKIRSLQDPYPNAYIVCADGKKLFITNSHIEDNNT